MKVRGIVALCLLAALAVVAVACGGADAEVKVDKGLAAYAGTNNLGVAQQNTGEAARSAASTGSGSEVSYDEQLGSPKAMSAVAPGVGGSAADSAALAPLEQTGPLGIVVQGYGRATATADTAVVTFVVGSSGYPTPLGAERGVATEDSGEGSAGSSAPSEPVAPDVYPTPVPPTPITEADLQPLIDAIKAQGVSDADIEVTIYPFSCGYYYCGSSTARVTATLHDMGKVGGLVDAGYQAVANSDILYIQNVGVTYSVDNCDVLLAEARKAAVEDARDNGAGLAEALGVDLGAVQGASEYSYDPYGYSGCQAQSEPVYNTYEGPSYDPALPAEVQIISTVTISFAMQ